MLSTNSFMRQNLMTTNRKPRVVVLGIRGFPDIQGGIEKHCQELYTRLAAMGFDITVIARKNYLKHRTGSFDGVKMVPLWAPRKKHLEAIFHTALGILWIARRRRKFDILHLHAIGPSLLAFAARRLRLRLVITHHGQDYHRKKWGILAKKMLHFGEFLAARYAYMVIAVSAQIQQLLLDKYDSVAVHIPNGVESTTCVPAGPILTRYGLKKGRYFLAVGRLVPEKGFHVLVHAYSRLNTDWNLVIAGEADHEDIYSLGLKNEAKKIKGVVMTGFQTGEALAELYSHAGLFILPSYHEGLPIVALEAMSYGLPVLVSDIPANKEIVSEEEIFPTGDVQALADRLNFVVNQGLTLDLSERYKGRWKRIHKEHNWNSVAEKTAKVYEAVTKMPAQKAPLFPRRLK